MILDACRNNPFEGLPDLKDNGLAEMKAPPGTFIALATAPGGVALDGLGANSPFTMALAEHMGQPGLAIEQVFKNMRKDVMAATRGQQTPWDTSSLLTDFTFVAEKVLSAEDRAALQLWNTVQQLRDPVQIMLFVRAYPESKYVPDAYSLLEQVMAEEIAAVAKPSAQTSASDEERALFEAVKGEGTADAFQTYLDAFPKGVFLEEARERLAALKPSGPLTDPSPEPAPTPVPVAEAAPDKDEIKLPDEAVVITMTSPLIAGNDVVRDQTISQLINGSPKFPPIEGLPDELWKEQKCSNCHQWTKEALCQQAQVYADAEVSRSINKQHPYGGGLKVNLRQWAKGGCQ
ncbi:caspase family protein [Ruegeria aquimaris]|uniref:caspase family protein n=1 Tax=Ruegeria aquimaris TaxID=2984333 RepID=UPI0021E7D3F8|nr:caspase family protein [Ruegeria sp. XHP0148]